MGANVNTRGMHYNNAFRAAVSGGHEPIVRLLLEKDTDVDAQEALYTASSRGHEPIVKLLLEKGADVNAQGGFYG
ncbi:hypothetical protein DM02DRAFT_576716, partial [Periconia macrospinosa]